MYKIVNNMTPKYLHDLLPQTLLTATCHNTRQTSDLYHFCVRTALFDKSHQWFEHGINYLLKSLVLVHLLCLNKIKYVPRQPIQNAELYYFGKHLTAVKHSRL